MVPEVVDRGVTYDGDDGHGFLVAIGAMTDPGYDHNDRRRQATIVMTHRNHTRMATIPRR